MILKTNEEFSELLKEDLVLVDFFATWCGPCKMLSPIIEQFAAKHPEFKVVKVDVDEFNELAGIYQVRSIPTLVILRKGNEVARRLGFIDLNNLENWFNQNK